MSTLRKDSLSFMETIGQSVANVSPTLTPTLVVAVVVGMAGTASWLVYLAATIAMVIVGINVGKLAKRIPCAGSFFIYVSRSLGPSWGLLSGWAMLAAYLTTAMALTVATSIFIKMLFAALHIGFVPNSIMLYAIISGLALLCASRDIRFSSRMGLTLEIISVALILITCVVIVSHYGFKIDTKQLDLSNLDYGKAIQAIVFAIFSYVGFESAATLGQESRNPERVIPRAIITDRARRRALLHRHHLCRDAGLQRRRHQARRQRCPARRHHLRAEPCPLHPRLSRRNGQQLRLRPRLAQRLRPHDVFARPLPVPARFSRTRTHQAPDALRCARDRRRAQLPARDGLQHERR